MSSTRRSLSSQHTTAERRKTPKKLLYIFFVHVFRYGSRRFRLFIFLGWVSHTQNPKREEQRLHRVEESYYCIKYGRARASLNEGQQVAQSRVLTACRVVVACREHKLKMKISFSHIMSVCGAAVLDLATWKISKSIKRWRKKVQKLFWHPFVMFLGSV